MNGLCSKCLVIDHNINTRWLYRASDIGVGLNDNIFIGIRIQRKAVHLKNGCQVSFLTELIWVFKARPGRKVSTAAFSRKSGTASVLHPRTFCWNCNSCVKQGEVQYRDWVECEKYLWLERSLQSFCCLGDFYQEIVVIALRPVW